MGFLQAIGRAYREFRGSLENPQTPLSYPAEWLLDIFNGGRTDAGIRVSELTALQVVDVFACVNLISGAMGMMDLHVSELVKMNNGRFAKRTAYEHDLYDLLENEPNPEMSAFTFRKTLQCHGLLWGNGYAELQRDNANRIVALWPRNPARIRPRRLTGPAIVSGERLETGELVYSTTEGMEQLQMNPEVPETGTGTERLILKEDVMHIPGLSLDGRLGQSTIWLARQAIGLSLAQEKFGAKFYGNGARPGGIITYPGKLKQEDREKMKQSWREAQGGENAGTVAVLESGMTWTEVSTKPTDAQAVESREYQREQTCSVFLVPPHMIGNSKSLNRANTEQIGIEFVTFTMGPHISAWQQEMKRKLFPKVGRTANKYLATFNTRPLVMPDAASKKAFYDSGKQWGWLSTNMICELEGFNPVDDPDADALWMPINMQKMGAQAPDDNSADNVGARYAKAYSRLFRDAFGRICARSSPDSEAFRRAFMPLFLSLGDEFQRLCGTESETAERDTFAFLSDYIDGMRKRLPEWLAANGNASQVAEKELARAIKAISIEVYRNAATAKAKQLTEVTA